MANFLFLGPTGSGKTRTVEALAEALVGDERAAIKIDCAEFQHRHEIAKLIGSPPGYLGHRETHPLLSQEILDQHHTDTCEAQLRAVRRNRKGQRRPVEPAVGHPGPRHADAGRQPPRRFFASHDFSDQQPGRVRDGSHAAAAGWASLRRPPAPRRTKSWPANWAAPEWKPPAAASLPNS